MGSPIAHFRHTPLTLSNIFLCTVKLQKDFLNRIPALKGLNYWEKLKSLIITPEEARKISDNLCLEDPQKQGSQL